MVPVPVYILTKSILGFLSSTFSAAFGTSWGLSFYFSFVTRHSKKYKVISHYSFDFVALVISDVEHIFMDVFLCLGKMFRSFDHISIRLSSYLLNCVSSLYILDINDLLIMVWKYVFPIS